MNTAANIAELCMQATWVQAVKKLRENTNLGLKEAKDIIDHARGIGLWVDRVRYLQKVLDDNVWSGVATVTYKEIRMRGDVVARIDFKDDTFSVTAGGQTVTLPANVKDLVIQALS